MLYELCLALLLCSEVIAEEIGKVEICEVFRPFC